jgi:hypothetical protein
MRMALFDAAGVAGVIAGHGMTVAYRQNGEPYIECGCLGAFPDPRTWGAHIARAIREA